jgi:ribosomal protein L16 Arg81 hydroxylase
MIRIISPPLDLLLAVTERVARVLAPGDPDYVPARIAHEGESAPRGLRVRS